MKKIINDNNPTIINIILYSLFFMILFLIIFLPFVLIASINNPNILEISYHNVNGDTSNIFQFFDVLCTISEFLTYGTIAEFIRKKRNLKFKLFDNESTIFYIYFIIFQIIYIISSIFKFFL